MSQQEELSDLTTTLFDWFNSQHQDVLIFQDADLTGAFKRYLYIDAIARPQLLWPILAASKAWRHQHDQHHLAEVFDRYYAGSHHTGGLSLIKIMLLLWGRVAVDLIKNAQLELVRIGSAPVNTQGGIGLFAINKRFIGFFDRLLAALDSRHQFFLPARAMNDGLHQTSEIQLASVPMQAAMGLLLKGKLTFFHPLYPVYFRLMLFYAQISRSLHQAKPDVLLFAEGTSHYDELASQAARQLNIPTIRVQSGRGGILHCGYRNMSFDAMLCWSEDFVERYKSVSQAPAYFICGTPLLDEYVAKTLENDRDKKKSIAIYTQPVCKEISEDDYAQLVILAEQMLKNASHLEIIVRKHPVDAHQSFERLADRHNGRIRIMNSPQYSLAETYALSSCATGFFSTALSEAAACGVIPVILHLSEQHSVYPFPEKHGAALISHSVEEAVEVITHIHDSPHDFADTRNKMQQFSARFFGPSDGKSLARMVGVIKAYVKGEIDVD